MCTIDGMTFRAPPCILKKRTKFKLSPHSPSNSMTCIILNGALSCTHFAYITDSEI